PDQSPRLRDQGGDIRAVPGGVSAPAAASRPRRLHFDRCRTRAPGTAGDRICLAAVRSWPARHDDGDPAIRVPERMAAAPPLDRLAAADRRARARRRFARSAGLDENADAYETVAGSR